MEKGIDLDRVSVTFKLRGKNGRWKSAKSMKLNDFLGALGFFKDTEMPIKTTWFDRMFKTKRYMTKQIQLERGFTVFEIYQKIMVKVRKLLK